MAFTAIRRPNCKAMMILVLAHCIIRGFGTTIGIVERFSDLLEPWMERFRTFNHSVL